MSYLSDPAFVADQYRTASNLDARVELHRRFSTNSYGWPRWVFDRLEIPSQGEVLELGCGPGHLWRNNLDRIPEGWAVTLSDLSTGMVEEAQQNLATAGCAFRFQVIDAQSIPHEDGSFDAVIANHMLYHVPDPEVALSEMRRVLRSGGRLYASTVGRTHMRELNELILRLAPDTEVPRMSPVESFVLENGGEQIARWFSGVTLHRYEDDLVITEAEPLIAYVLSSFRSAFVHDRLAEFVAFVEGELATHGHITITKDTGLFEALRGEKET